ncbi:MULTISPECIES: conjugal transfer protein TrbL [Cryobacterium]|uniref:conjugal transfer protein TrbL n=1 Tax=Cryobacterium TaxID=69578 RepID=UPI000CD3B442|nr:MULTISPECIES: conjugal transfer protein TrbL [Cryobacterium]POH66081.1 conjugal transfer protein TrbL [Cryobacterium zongtaii]TFC46748.1 conjugal transfer protein TrbL [Cryobacterium sp. TMN-39-2]
MSVCDVPVIASVCDAVGEGTASLVAAPFDWLANAMGSAAAWLFESVWAAFDTTTLVDVTDPGYIDVYNVLFGVAVFVTLVLFCLQLITGLIRRDPTALSRAATGLAKSVLGAFVLITITALLLEITDQLTIGIVQASGNTMEGMGDRIALLPAGLTAINVAAPGVGAIVTIFLSALAISAAAIVWFSLLIRKALLLVAIVFGPIALAGATWDAAKGWFAKWVAFVIALILSKLVLVVIFLVAVAQVSAPIDADLASISDPIAGIVLMFVAAFAPYITYKFISFVGFDMYHAMSSEQEAKSALNRPVPVPAAPMAESAKKILGPNGGDEKGATAPTAQTATTSPSGPGPTTASPTGSPGPPAGASSPASSGGASAGAGAGGAGAAAGVGSAGIVVGAAVAGAAAEAGPGLGNALGQTADNHTQAVGDSAGPSAPTAEPEPMQPRTPTPLAEAPASASGLARKDI